MGFFDGGPIRIMINIFCAAILYVIFYAIYIISKYINKAVIWRTREIISIPFYAILDVVLYFLFWVSIITIVFIGTVFLVLYMVWKVINKIGLGFIINGVTPFSDCISTGLFPFFDKLVDIIFGNDEFGKRLNSAAIASSEFLKTFMKEAFGLVFEGYELDDEYLTAALNSFIFSNMYADDVQKCLDAKTKFLEISKQKTPVFKLTYDDEPPEKQLSETDNINIRNCIRENTVDIPKDANTIERLQIIFSNAVAKQQCYLNIQNNANCMVADIEKSVTNLGNKISSSSLQSLTNSSSSATEYYDTSVSSMEKSNSKGNNAQNANN